jgi:predicted ribosome quality control (RQC) complex YloA/Tae2 family protein
MIQYYRDLENQVKSIRETPLAQGQIQKIYSTAYYVSLAVRARGKTWHLYLGRGGGHEGVWLHDSPPPAELRRKDTFLEYLRRHVSSCSFAELSVDRFDRIVRLDYMKFGERNSLLWFWKGRKLYFLHRYLEQPAAPMKLLLSWRGRAIVPGAEPGDLFDYFDEIGRLRDMKHDLVSPSLPDVAELLAEELRASSLKTQTSAPTFLQRKKKNIEADLRRAKQWEKLQALLDRGEPLEAVYELKVDDQKIRFEGELNPYERRNLLFQKIKKLKRGETILRERLGSVEAELSGAGPGPMAVSQLPIVKPIWGEEKAAAREAPKSAAGDEYRIIAGPDLQIGVGLSAHGNDQLRNKWASKDDHWIHLDGLKSTHVIVKTANGAPVPPEVLNLGASIVAHFSHFTGDWIPIIHTQVKNLKGVSGAAGMVTYKKEKHLRCPRVSLDGVLKD